VFADTASACSPRRERDAAGATVSDEHYTQDLDDNTTTTVDGDGNTTVDTYDGNHLVSREIRAGCSARPGTAPTAASL
jgi:hypothetical protein